MIETELEVRYDKEIREGTAELYHWYYAGAPLEVLYFQTEEQYHAWKNGQPFRLINHWHNPAKPPRGK